MANPAELVVRPVDRFQQKNHYAGFVFGVIKKFGDDRGGMLSSLVTFYGFLSVFPLLLVAVTVLGFVLNGHPDLAGQVRDSFLHEIPLVGDQLDKGLNGSGLGLVIGILGLLYGSLGASQAIQFAVNEAWDVPNKNRPNFFVRLGRGLGFYAILGTGVIVTTVLSALGVIVGSSEIAGALGLVSALVVNIGLFLVVFRLLGPKHLRWTDHLPGAVVAGIGWQVLQSVAQQLVQHNLKHTQALYGQFAIALGLISFLSLASQLTMYSVEINVVRNKRLWPRSIVQPPLLEADRTALAMRATQEERRPEQLVDVSWEDRGEARPRSPEVGGLSAAAGSATGGPAPVAQVAPALPVRPSPAVDRRPDGSRRREAGGSTATAGFPTGKVVAIAIASLGAAVLGRRFRR